MPETRSLSIGRLTTDPAWTRRHDPDDRGPCKQRRPPTLERPSTRHPNPHQSACQPPRTHALQRLIGLAPRRQAATTTEPFMPHPKGGASGRHETNRHRRKKPSSEDRSIAARRWTHEGSRCTDSRLLHHQHQHQLATNTRHQLKTSHAARTKNGDQFQRSNSASTNDQQPPSLRRLEFINRATVDSIASRIQTEGRAMASNLLGWTAVARPSRERSTRIPARAGGPL
jgi:hypothetical protein